VAAASGSGAQRTQLSVSALVAGSKDVSLRRKGLASASEFQRVYTSLDVGHGGTRLE
jgi:hypothetical protein